MAESLASLALVNRDCRQLARSRQFASVCLDYSPNSVGLLHRLLEEGDERASNNNSTVLPTLGACVRRLTVATRPGWITHRHNIDLSDEFDSLTEETINKLLETAAVHFFEHYVPLIQAAVVGALPHLELLDWEDHIVGNKRFYDSLSLSRAKHAKLFYLGIDEEFKLGSKVWPLRTLHLELLWIKLPDEPKGSTATLCASILRACASTIECLSWKGSQWGEGNTKVASQDSEDAVALRPSFPRLRDLDLEHPPFSSSLRVEDLFSPILRALSADTDDPQISQQAGQSGTMRNLETFCWNTIHIPEDHNLTFLRQNTQISKLFIQYPIPSSLMAEELLPLLPQSFRNLRSLWLTWTNDSIPVADLELVGSIASLEQLHLSAGFQHGWRRTWMIDHSVMRKCLAPLKHLKKLAVERDSYFFGERYMTNLERYYSHRSPRDPVYAYRPDLPEDFLEKIWERQHRAMILKHAQRYVRVLRNLKWLYIGQLPIGVLAKGEDRGTADEGSEVEKMVNRAAIGVEEAEGRERGGEDGGEEHNDEDGRHDDKEYTNGPAEDSDSDDIEDDGRSVVALSSRNGYWTLLRAMFGWNMAT